MPFQANFSAAKAVPLSRQPLKRHSFAAAQMQIPRCARDDIFFAGTLFTVIYSWRTAVVNPSRGRGRLESAPHRFLFFEGDVHQQLVAFDLDHVAERTAALAGKVEADAAVADAQVADAQML